jgi:hypothetical protein
MRIVLLQYYRLLFHNNGNSICFAGDDFVCSIEIIPTFFLTLLLQKKGINTNLSVTAHQAAGK